MADNTQKLWLQQNLLAVATQRALAEIERTGRALPCQVTAVNGSIVTVTFEVTNTPWTLPPLTLPKAESQWLRAPTQVGDFGMTVPADTFLGGISGLGAGTADLTVDYGNMSTLVWVPVGSTDFAAGPTSSSGKSMAWVNGPDGAALTDDQQTTGIWADPTNNTVQITAPSGGSVTITVGSKTWTFDATGFTDSNSVVEETHVHGEVQSGSSMTGPPES